MADEPTELDKLRAEYARQIIDRVRNVEGYPDSDVMYLVDNLLLEWGHKAYYAGADFAVAATIKQWKAMGFKLQEPLQAQETT